MDLSNLNLSRFGAKSPLKPPIPATAPDPPLAPDHVPDSYDPAKIPIGALFVGNRDIHELSRILGTNITSVEDLFKSTRRLTEIKVGGVNLTLEPGLIERLYSRSGGQDFTIFLNETIKSLLAGFCGW